MTCRSKLSFSLVFLGVMIILSVAAYGQPTYYTPGGSGGPLPTDTGMGYPGPDAYGTTPETGPGAPGPIVARPFTVQPPRILLGERMKEEGVNLEYVDVEAITGMPITEDQIPRVNTLEEYRKVLSKQVRAIFFDGKVYIYDQDADAYKPRDWQTKERNEALWAQIDYERQVALRIQMQQQMQARMAAWRSQQAQMRGRMADQRRYAPGAGTSGFAPGTMPPTGSAPAVRRGR